MRTPFRKFSKVSALLHHEVKLRVRALFFFLRMCACPICAQWYTYSKTLSVVAFHSKCARELTLEKLHQGLLTCRFFSLSLFLCTYILTVYIYTYMNGSCGQWPTWSLSLFTHTQTHTQMGFADDGQLLLPLSSVSRLLRRRCARGACKSHTIHIWACKLKTFDIYSYSPHWLCGIMYMSALMV